MNRPAKIPESVLVVLYSPALDVLLIERADHPGFWQSVTGSKDNLNEDLQDTVAREVEEETGIRIVDGLERGASNDNNTPSNDACVPRDNLRDWGVSNVYEIYPVWRHRYAPGVTHNTEHVFGLRVPRHVPIRLAAREHTSFMWLPWREAADRCFSPSNAEAILLLPRFAT